ncbi:MAG TPA: ATPase, T2SS/T4P/T4SS family [Candidatus Omnitrophota bacterium]|nr:ATPase, T2SS/T4P/T4SS family [Candidatus Omnitrophota bacterium]HPS37518.1 ATPase, T2SS/T4P/T4SS family [Candidatus Omnitrophota bacterium]
MTEKSGGSLPDMREALLETGAVKSEDLLWASQEQNKGTKKEHFLDVLLRTGKCDEKKLVTILNTKYGYRLVSLKMLIVSKDVLRLVPKKTAETHACLPISLYEKTLTVAFANPTNLKVLDEIQAQTGLRVRAAVGEYSILREAIAKFYQDVVNPVEEMVAEEGGDELGKLASMVEKEATLDKQQQTADLMEMANQAPVVKLVNMILLEGVRRHSSDIFIEPWENFVRVRVRVDGILEEIVKPQKSFGNAIVSRIKIMSQLNIAEHRVPQDGRFKVRTQGREVDMRVSILPSSFGEKVCLRILDTGTQSHDISKLGFTQREQDIIKDSSKKPHGMILVTGPTGSGKTTTLYSVLKYLDSPKVNITTVEDPVEYQIPGINQVNVREAIGLTFPAALRSILRQDPDIILIGEIRDADTLDIAVKAALTGHLVLSTLHTNDAVSSITRMVNLGLEPFLIASTVLMISAQRLVRKLCPRCRVQYDLEPEMYKLLELDPAKKLQFWKARGCSQCRQLGYQGRSVITELFEMTPEILEMIMQGASADLISQRARERGMNTLRESAVQKAILGETSLEEVFRVTTADQTTKKVAGGGGA